MKNKFLKIVFTLSGIFTSFLLYAPPFDPPGGGGPTVGAHVDGGVSILIAAGVAYGIKKMRDKKKEDKEE